MENNTCVEVMKWCMYVLCVALFGIIKDFYTCVVVVCSILWLNSLVIISLNTLYYWMNSHYKNVTMIKKDELQGKDS